MLIKLISNFCGSAGCQVLVWVPNGRGKEQMAFPEEQGAVSVVGSVYEMCRSIRLCSHHGVAFLNPRAFYVFSV